MDSTRLAGKHAIVTGGASGIGKAISQRFIEEGARVHIWDMDQTRLETAQNEIDPKGKQSTITLCDVSDKQSVADAFSRLNRIEILVNNAGIAHIGNIENTTDEDFDRIFAVNVRGVFHCLKPAIALMKAQGKGAILNLASIASKNGISDRFAYSMSKGAVLTMTYSVAKDYVSHGIRCNCVCPARIHTPFVDAYLEDNYPNNKEEMFQKLSAYQPVGRMGEPEEVAALAAFLCSDDASFITGAAYDIDGGSTSLR